MKTATKMYTSVAVVLSWGALALSAQSTAASHHVSAAVAHSGAASAEVAKAGIQSGAASAEVVGDVIAVPVFISGVALASAGSIVSAVGDSAVAEGNATTGIAEKVWDSSTGDPAKRPAITRERAVPASKKITAVKPVDPAPGVMLRGSSKRSADTPAATR